MGRPNRQTLAYVALLAGGFALALVASWSGFGAKIDNNAYDFMFQVYRPRPWQPETILLKIDEPTLQAYNGMGGIRAPLARGLEKIAAAGARAVAIDLVLADRGDPEADARLEEALGKVRNLVLPCELIGDPPVWEDPLARFRRHAAGVGHVHAQPDDEDSVSRAIPLEKATARDRRWALSLEAYRVSRGAAIVESPDDLRVGKLTIPSRYADGRLMRVRYVPSYMAIPQVSLKALLDDDRLAARFSGKVAFAGVTAQSAAHDRVMTPYSYGKIMPGLEVHANAFETMAQGLFLTDAPNWWVLLFSLAVVIVAGVIFAWLPGWQAYAAGSAVLALVHFTPYWFFTGRTVFSFITPVSSGWISMISAAGYQTLVVRRRLRKAEAERVRYQQAMHFVTHEMRTPLTAIQGSSELISRYSLPEEKRKQIAQLINSESKRLGRMIEMFLNVERLSAGQMELKKENFGVAALMSGCVERIRGLAERKQIRITLEPAQDDLTLVGDRELMEYAYYNLLTNAIKYSPQKTEVLTSARSADGRVHISVRDQGIGMDQKEVKKIFRKFYRTRKAEESGEAGTGIGLSIVEQIVAQHGGAIDVVSHPGQGSCFTLVLPVPVAAVLAEHH
jgi:signal transduction histidine kinase